MKWRSDPCFEHVSDELANDRVVFLTGAGISLDLSDDKGRKLPTWGELLQRLQADAASTGVLTARDQADLDCLLEGSPSPTSAHFLEAATILSAAIGSDFPDRVSDATRSPGHATTDLHRVIHHCNPRAIVTFNYDEGHEAAAKEIEPMLPAWDLILPADPDLDRSETRIRRALAPDGLRRQLVKAHGSVTEPRSLVLTRESYREVLVRRPAYRALLSHIFVNYTVVAVGFGLDDPDFQMTLDALEREVGGSLRKHVYITRRPSSADVVKSRQEVIMRRRFGFEPLFCSSWSELPEMLRDLTIYAGPKLRATVDASVNPSNAKRGEAHSIMARFSASGSARAVELVNQRLSTETDDWRRAEWCYSLGRINPKLPMAKSLLRTCIEERRGIRSMATAVVGFIEHANASDIPWLRAQLALWQSDPHPNAGSPSDPDNRVKVYLEYAIQKTTAKHAAWNGPQ